MIFLFLNHALLQDLDDLIISPSLLLMADITGLAANINRLLSASEAFQVIITITHDSMNADDVHILELSVEYFEGYLLAPASASYLFSNGEAGEYGMIILMYSLILL